jgi:hypothetical protein
MNRKRVMSAGVFHKIPRIDDFRLAEIFAREVLAISGPSVAACSLAVLMETDDVSLSASGPSRPVFLSILTSPEPGFMLVRGKKEARL